MTTRRLLNEFKILATVTIVIGSPALAQPTNDWITATKCGNAVSGVRLSISLNTNIIAISSALTVHAEVKNTSTNTVYIFHSGRLPHDFGVFVTDESGKRFDLTPKRQKYPVNPDFGSLNLDVRPGSAREDEARITLGKELKPGKYRLELTREIHTSDPQITNPAISNPLSIRLIQSE